MAAINVSIVADDAVARQDLEALIAGTADLEVLSVYSNADDALAGLDARPGHVLVVRCSNVTEQLNLARRLAARFPALRVLALAADPGEESMLELVRGGAHGCLPARETQPARLLEAIVELHRGGAPLTPRLAAALVREAQTKSAAPAPLLRISRRETELLRLLANGHSYKTAAAELGLSIDTVRFHLRNVYAKLQVHSKLEAVLKAAREGLI